MNSKTATRFILTLLLCINPMFHSTSVLAAAGDEEMAEAEQAERAGHFAESETKYREAIEKFKDKKRDLPLGFAWDSLGSLYFKRNQLDKAADAYSKTVDARKAVLTRGTDDNGAPLTGQVLNSLQKDLGLAMMSLGSVYTRQKEYEKAEKLLFDALEIVKATFGPEHDCVGVVLAAIGDLRFAQGNYAEAEKYYAQAIVIRRKYHSLNDPEISALLKNHSAVAKIQRKAGH